MFVFFFRIIGQKLKAAKTFHFFCIYMCMLVSLTGNERLELVNYFSSVSQEVLYICMLCYFLFCFVWFGNFFLKFSLLAVGSR